MVDSLDLISLSRSSRQSFSVWKVPLSLVRSSRWRRQKGSIARVRFASIWRLGQANFHAGLPPPPPFLLAFFLSAAIYQWPAFYCLVASCAVDFPSHTQPCDLVCVYLGRVGLGVVGTRTRGRWNGMKRKKRELYRIVRERERKKNREREKAPDGYKYKRKYLLPCGIRIPSSFDREIYADLNPPLGELPFSAGFISMRPRCLDVDNSRSSRQSSSSVKVPRGQDLFKMENKA